MATLNDILGKLQAGTPTQKTASENPKVETPSKGALAEVVGKTAAAIAPEPSAGVNSSANPAEELMKIAASLVGAEKQAEIEEMRMLGGAFADGALTKFALFEMEAQKQAAVNYEKVASTPAPSQGVDPDMLVKIAAEIGYQDTVGRIVLAAEEEKKEKEKEKEKEKGEDKDKGKDKENKFPNFLKKKKEDKDSDSSEEEKKANEYSRGVNEAVEQVKAAASFEFIKGAAVAEAIINQEIAKQKTA